MSLLRSISYWLQSTCSYNKLQVGFLSTNLYQGLDRTRQEASKFKLRYLGKFSGKIFFSSENVESQLGTHVRQQSYPINVILNGNFLVKRLQRPLDFYSSKSRPWQHCWYHSTGRIIHLDLACLLVN